ncbi:MAG: hypothetical protein QT00_C0002G0009 [archaeon GW2011_AR5]|nr:MAG: hypothetical protein QT00_C0002G0009 [archaeon GW2011_AR5]
MTRNIEWLEWSKEAFEKAKRENKPILLDIYGVWCHWCHEQDKSYEDEIVIDTVNEKFVPIKVDTDKRPDINERYNQGGWPTTAFLTPDGMIIAGATYLPPAQLAMMLEQVSNYFQKGDIQFEIHKQETQRGDVASSMEFLADEMLLSFDTLYGGFGSQPKFPMPDLIEAALLRFRQTNDKGMLRIATKTLDGMMGIFDKHEGGFFRYSVTREWDEPHYEKMLETNAQMAAAYFNAFLVTGDEKYKYTAERTADFIVSVLGGTDGFYGSQDADKEEEYYGKPAEERKKMKQPFIDRNVYVSLNALAISSLLQLGGNYKDIAIRTMENLWTKCFDTEKGMCHYYDGRQNVFGLLADNVNFLRCLLDAYEKTSNVKYVTLAVQLMDLVTEKFYNDGFTDRAHGEDIGLLNAENKNINENSVAAGCLTRLSFYTGDEKYRKTAEETLSVFTNYGQYRLHAASYTLAVEKLIDPIEITARSLEFITGLPHDFRLMVKFDNNLPCNLMACLGGTCMRFNGMDEAKKHLLVMR